MSESIFSMGERLFSGGNFILLMISLCAVSGAPSSLPRTSAAVGHRCAGVRGISFFYVNDSK